MKHVINAAHKTARKGGSVLILTKTPKDFMGPLLKKTPNNPGLLFSRSNGNEYIVYKNGGSIRFIRHAFAGRGHSTDLLIVPVGLSHDDKEELIPCVATGGDIIGYY